MEAFDICNLIQYLNLILCSIDPFEYNQIQTIQFIYHTKLEDLEGFFRQNKETLQSFYQKFKQFSEIEFLALLGLNLKTCRILYQRIEFWMKVIQIYQSYFQTNEFKIEEISEITEKQIQNRPKSNQIFIPENQIKNAIMVAKEISETTEFINTWSNSDLLWFMDSLNHRKDDINLVRKLNLDSITLIYILPYLSKKEIVLQYNIVEWELNIIRNLQTLLLAVKFHYQYQMKEQMKLQSYDETLQNFLVCIQTPESVDDEQSSMDGSVLSFADNQTNAGTDSPKSATVGSKKIQNIYDQYTSDNIVDKRRRFTSSNSPIPHKPQVRNLLLNESSKTQSTEKRLPGEQSSPGADVNSLQKRSISQLNMKENKNYSNNNTNSQLNSFLNNEEMQQANHNANQRQQIDENFEFETDSPIRRNSFLSETQNRKQSSINLNSSKQSQVERKQENQQNNPSSLKQEEFAESVLLIDTNLSLQRGTSINFEIDQQGEYTEIENTVLKDCNDSNKSSKAVKQIELEKSSRQAFAESINFDQNQKQIKNDENFNQSVIINDIQGSVMINDINRNGIQSNYKNNQTSLQDDNIGNSVILNQGIQSIYSYLSEDSNPNNQTLHEIDLPHEGGEDNEESEQQLWAGQHRKESVLIQKKTTSKTNSGTKQTRKDSCLFDDPQFSAFLEQKDTISPQKQYKKSIDDKIEKLNSHTFQLPFNPFDFQSDQVLQIQIQNPNRDDQFCTQTINIDGATIGRKKDNDISILDDPKISSKHALIYFCGDSFYLKDRGSKSGTWVNSKKIKLNSGIEFKLGNQQEVKILKQIQKVDDTFEVVIGILVENQYKEQNLEIKKGQEFIFGRNLEKTQNYINITDNECIISKSHAKIVNFEGNLFLIDINSVNGTWVRLSPRKQQSFDFCICENTRFYIHNIQFVILDLPQKELN